MLYTLQNGTLESIHTWTCNGCMFLMVKFKFYKVLCELVSPCKCQMLVTLCERSKLQMLLQACRYLALKQILHFVSCCYVL